MPWIIVRPPAVYGPGDRATLPLIAQLAQRHAVLPGTSDGKSSLIHVEDLANALVMLALTGTPTGTMHELHDGKIGGYSWRELADAVARNEDRPARIHHVPKPVMMAAAYGASLVTRVTGKPAMLSPGKVRELYHADWVARHNLLNDRDDWQPAIEFAKGVADTLDWYRKHQWLPDTKFRTGKRETAI